MKNVQTREKILLKHLNFIPCHKTITGVKNMSCPHKKKCPRNEGTICLYNCIAKIVENNDLSNTSRALGDFFMENPSSLKKDFIVPFRNTVVLLPYAEKEALEDRNRRQQDFLIQIRENLKKIKNKMEKFS